MRIPSARSGHRAWVVIYPLAANRAASRAVLRDFGQPVPLRDMQVYHVRRLEAERLSLGQILQKEDADVHCFEEFFAYGDQHLVDRLEQYGFSIATFYPLTTAAAADDDGAHTLRPVAL